MEDRMYVELISGLDQTISEVDEGLQSFTISEIYSIASSLTAGEEPDDVPPGFIFFLAGMVLTAYIGKRVTTCQRCGVQDATVDVTNEGVFRIECVD